MKLEEILAGESKNVEFKESLPAKIGSRQWDKVLK